MPKYLFTYHGGSMPETEAEQAEVMQAWGAWYSEIGEALVDPGNPVGPSKTVQTDGSVTDGGGANPVSGYTLINADSLDLAVKIAQSSPILSSHAGTVEVGEAAEM